VTARLSVIIPTYNAGPYLAESIDSVLGQVVADDEVIVVDDGSTDETPEILARYGGRLSVVMGGHLGCAAARNLGLERARGQWVAFHDADDVARPNRFQLSLAFLESQNAYDAVFCNGLRMGLPDGPASRVVPPHFAGGLLTSGSVFAGYPVYFQGAVVPRQAFSAAGPFNPRYQIQPDLDYGYRLFPHCRGTFIDEVAFDYRWHATNMTRDRLAVREDIARILEALPTTAPGAVSAIGTNRLRKRLARHYFRIGRMRMQRNDLASASAAFRRAAALQPLHPQYQWARLRHGFG
jgi:glycosyltransferase involved in cell wall biosynthesis